ncbi:hypothetical protein ASPZODRAFT_23504 [Penicilliopsis zonata CBS 506.65]|uniref:UDP-N-acetylglucosamine transferase subunit ALG13 n=1 Tax=Penicilliopsis zonata CBS 506.65 TaxID=1073090 RepID=A0A1L9SQ92_9EURO|nr:hypothetical protein ASPZODRAFT_23504 [Penicilliopsis zonata CBS 506.65]OJJ49247.1 hypothetical protein ASPZODRAFT_23504 [Penicilliopsis zonata CBS 506.65]
MTSPAPMKVCFVTVGATASFEPLVSAVLDGRFLASLGELGYTNLLVQYGKDGRPIFDRFLQDRDSEEAATSHSIQVDGFDFNQAGLGREMRLAQENAAEGRRSGAIISHAGSGSILEALRLGIPLVVVPNSSLKDNHQEELARELQKQGYVVASHYEQLPSAIRQAEDLRARMMAWPPVDSVQTKRKQPLAGVMSDELGFLD